jgi:nucleotide-binding universal stress UspA family protein
MWINTPEPARHYAGAFNNPFGEAAMYKRILVATDGSALSKKAVDHAVNLAQLSGADLVGVTVVGRYPVSFFDGDISGTLADAARIEAQWMDAASKTTQAVERVAASKGVNAKVVVAKSVLVGEAIISTAKKNKCDLIVMASHGRKGVKRLLLGSETQHVLTHSDIPVLVLR